MPTNEQTTTASWTHRAYFKQYRLNVEQYGERVPGHGPSRLSETNSGSPRFLSRLEGVAECFRVGTLAREHRQLLQLLLIHFGAQELGHFPGDRFEAVF
jgi:hypothetical protein